MAEDHKIIFSMVKVSKTLNTGKTILKDIYLEQPDVVCFSCYIWNISFVRELVPDLKKILPQVELWAGGPEVSYDAVEFLKKNPAFFGVMVGEGEETFHELAGYYIERKWGWDCHGLPIENLVEQELKIKKAG